MYRMLMMATAFLLVTGCNQDAREAQGFSLPEGNADRGKALFTELQCVACHSIGDMTQDADQAEFAIKLGGTDRGKRSYGELVTAVINPSHRISRSFPSATGNSGDSNMQNYNEVMTVQQLVDLVTFLRSEYDVQPYSKTRYYEYYKDK